MVENMIYISKEWRKYEFKTSDELLEFLNQNKDDILSPPVIIKEDNIYLVLIYITILNY